jgi:hypothetical protein
VAISGLALLKFIVLTCLHSHDDKTAHAVQLLRLDTHSSLEAAEYMFSLFENLLKYFAI